MRIVIVTIILWGALCLWYGYTRSTLTNSEPVSLPFPAVGASQWQEFHLADSGRFMFQVNTSVKGKDEPPVPCDIDVTVTGPRGLVLRHHIASLSNGGSGDLYHPADLFLFILPGGGDYTFTMESRVPVDVFMRRGAIVHLERWENIGSALGWELAKLVGYGSLGVAALVTLLAGRPWRNAAAG